MKHHYLTLDALRGVAAIAVVARHLDGLSPGNPFPASYLAVDFFFGLSGFVLAHAYGRRLGEGLSFRRFALARLIRLYPLYFIAGLLALLTLGLKIVVGEAAMIDLLVGAANLVLIPLPLGEDRFQLYPLNFPAWSLGFELLVNVVFALIILWLTTWRLVSLLVVSALALMAAGIHFGSLDVGSLWSDVMGGFARVTFSFFLGVGVYRLHKAFPVRLPGLAVVPVTLMLLASFLPAVSFQGFYDVLAIVVIFPVLLFVGAAITPPKAAQGVCAFLGVTSYAIYVIHAPMRDVVLAVLHYVPLAPSWGMTIAFILLALVASWIVDKMYDGPIRARLTDKLLPRPNPAAVSDRADTV